MFAWAPLQTAQLRFNFHIRKKHVCGLQSRSFTDGHRFLTHVQHVYMQFYVKTKQLWRPPPPCRGQRWSGHRNRRGLQHSKSVKPSHIMSNWLAAIVSYLSTYPDRSVGGNMAEIRDQTEYIREVLCIFRNTSCQSKNTTCRQITAARNKRACRDGLMLSSNAGPGQ